MDLMGGRVVRARRGGRWRYRPLRSALCPDSRPLAVAEALMDLYPFARLYLADLDAIAGTGDNRRAIDHIQRRYPHLELWTDCGIHDAAGLRRRYARRAQTPVLGSETLRSPAVLQTAALIARAPVLSLDFRGPAFLGPKALLTAPGLWPRRVILMTLERVGSRRGPDLARLRRLSRHTGPRAWYAAGGVRGPQDLERLRAMGVAGILVASALHDGCLDPGLLARYGSA
jgi:phosphoribosylformimino-5-aminoimidazole carboxamide ribotide isomerase